MLKPHPFNPAEIADNDIYTGRELRRILAEVLRDEAPYLKIGAAATITGTKRATLKSAAARYYRQQENSERPAIRMRRTSAVKGAHWLFHEGDCFAVRRSRGMPAAVLEDVGPLRGHFGDALAVEDETDVEIIARYVMKTTSNL